jgi:Ca2+-binding RTX toxin-like protein
MFPGSSVFTSGELTGELDTNSFSIILRAGEVYDFWLGGQSSEDNDDMIVDPRLDLAGPGLTVPLSDDNSGQGFDAVLTYTPPAGSAGTYTLTVCDVENGSTGGYYSFALTNRSFDADITDHIFAIHNNAPKAFGTDSSLIQGDVLISNIGDPELGFDLDFVSVQLVANQTYTFRLGGASTGDGTLASGRLQLRDGDGAELKTDDMSTDAGSFTYTPTQSGVFFLDVAGFDTGGTYSLQFTSNGAAVDVAGSVNTSANVPLGDTIRGEIGAAGEDGSDWYAVHLVAGQQYQFDLGKLTLGDPGLTLRAGGGGVVAQGVDVAGGVDDRLVFTANSSGVYYLDVHSEKAGGAGTYALTAQRLGAAAEPAHVITGSDGQGYWLDGAQSDVITGSPEQDVIQCGAGDDTAAAGQSKDFVTGDTGNDSLDGGGGDDEMSGGAGSDTMLGGSGDDMLFGDDDLVALVAGPGGGSADQLWGGEGNDTLDGDDANDFMAGGVGDDVYMVESAGDVVSEGLNQGFDMVHARCSYTLSANVEDLTLEDALNFSGTGNALANIIYGNGGMNLLSGLAGNDTLNGGQGHDTLVGGAGKDLLTGSGGLDRMVFNSLSDSGPLFAQRDAINTFAHGDKVDLSAIDANINAGGNQAFAFVTNFTRAAGQLQWDQIATNSWLVTADVNGDAVADFSLNLYSAPGFGQLQSWDFIL